MTSGIIDKSKIDEAIYLAGTTLYMCVISSILGLIIFGIPSFLLALIYAGLRLTKRASHILLIIALGGFVAMGWCLATPFKDLSNVAFFAGSLTSLIMASFALPKS